MRKLLLAGVALVVVGIVIFMMFGGNKQSNGDGIVSDSDAPKGAEDIVIGDKEALVTIIEYGNFTCSHCGDFHKTVYQDIKKKYIDTGVANYILREVYTDAFGVYAGSFARCVPVSQYEGVASLLMERQSEWAFGAKDLSDARNILNTYARQIGLSDDDFNACLDDVDQQTLVVDYVQKRNQDANFTGTPSFFINGQAVTNWSFESLSAAIEAALAESEM